MESNLNIEQKQALSAYVYIKRRIKEIYKQISKAGENGEYFKHLHDELVMLELIVKQSRR
jgi:hypothetical protein